MKRHEWRERSEDGEVHIFRATKHGGLWTLQTKLKGADYWNRHDPLTRADVLIIREMLERKYQRNRAPYEDLTGIDKWLEEDQQRLEQATAKKEARRQRRSADSSPSEPSDGDPAQ